MGENIKEHWLEREYKKYKVTFKTSDTTNFYYNTIANSKSETLVNGNT